MFWTKISESFNALPVRLVHLVPRVDKLIRQIAHGRHNAAAARPVDARRLAPDGMDCAVYCWQAAEIQGVPDMIGIRDKKGLVQNLVLLFVVSVVSVDTKETQNRSHIVLDTVPETRVVSDRQGTRRELLAPKDKEKNRVTIIRDGLAFHWTSRENRKVESQIGRASCRERV